MEVPGKGKKYICVDKPAPLTMEEGTVYVDQEDGTASLICPCGCRAVIILSTIQGNRHIPIAERDPFWEINVNTIYPSIERTEGTCRSHFSIKNGIVE